MEEPMRYTSEASMDERGLRDFERWKDKIEVRLDNRQVFVLFFGSSLVACLLFVLGMIVGKRLESRGRAVAPEVEDPLALLDKVAATPRAAPEGGGFSKALPTAFAAAVKPPPAAALASEPAAASAPEPAAQAAAEPTAPSAQKGSPSPTGKSRARFMLQVGSFPDRAGAEAFAKRFSDDRPTVVESEIPGKGLWYRVRLGEYASTKDAMAGKAAFEKQHNIIAFVVPGPGAAAPVKTSAPR